MTDEYRYQLKRRKRGDYCLIDKCQWDHDYSRERSRRGLCGCGTRNPPGKRHKNRIVRRELQRQLTRESLSC